MRSWGAISTKKNVAFSTSKSPLKTAATFHQGSCCWTSVSPRHLHSPTICQPRLWVSLWDAIFLFGMASWQALEEDSFFGGIHYCQVPCWFHVGATNFAADFINTFLGHFEWNGPSTKDFCILFQPRHYNMFDGTLAISTPEMCPGHQGKTNTQMNLKQTLLTCEHKISCLIPPWLFNDESTHSNWQSPSNMGA